MMIQIHTVYTDRTKTHTKEGRNPFLLALAANKIKSVSTQKRIATTKDKTYISNSGRHRSSGHTVGFWKAFGMLSLSKDV